MRKNPDFLAVAKIALNQHYPDANLAFVCGSVIRGEDTPTSDIDLVVLYTDPEFDNVHRKSAEVEGWPIEFFVHTPKAQDFFMASDIASGIPGMVDMIAHGIPLPGPSDYSRERQKLAQSLLQSGPPALSAAEIEDRRYFLTLTLDDLVGAQDAGVRGAALSALYQPLGDFNLRASGNWSGDGKGLLRAMRRADPKMARSFEQAFQQAWQGDLSHVIETADKILKPHGGRLFDGYQRKAAASWGTFKGFS